MRGFLVAFTVTVTLCLSAFAQDTDAAKKPVCVNGAMDHKPDKVDVIDLCELEKTKVTNAVLSLSNVQLQIESLQSQLQHIQDLLNQAQGTVEQAKNNLGVVVSAIFDKYGLSKTDYTLTNDLKLKKIPPEEKKKGD